MGPLALLCAAALTGAPVASGPTYQVEVRLVDTTPSGERLILTAPVVTLPAGQGVRVQCPAEPGYDGETAEFRVVRENDEQFASDFGTAEEKNRVSAWRIRLANLDHGVVRLELTLRRPEVERLIDRGVLTQSRMYNIMQQIQPNKMRRIVLTCDETGRPISWVDVRIRRTVETERGQQDTSPHESAVYPFLREPY